MKFMTFILGGPFKFILIFIKESVKEKGISSESLYLAELLGKKNLRKL